MARVSLEDVEKSYGSGARVVSGFTLDIADGEFVVLVGPSGCGKSTTLRMIAGLEELTSGAISIGFRVVNDVPPKDRDIAMVFQSYALYPHMTVFENMAFGLKLRRLSKASVTQRVHAAADILGIGPLLDRRPAALSGGQRQRVALGRAIVREPKCFLFDEPLSNLDAKLRSEMRVELKQLHMQLRATTIYVTHDQEEAMTLGDRVVVMKDGIIQQHGSALEIYHQPTNRFVASFLGNRSMNFFSGQLLQEHGRLWFNGAQGRLPIPDWAAEQLMGRLGSELVLGVRPEALADPHSARFQTTDAWLEMRVKMLQPLGDKLDVHFETRGHTSCVACVDASSRVAVGDLLRVHFDPERLNFFENSETGGRLALNQQRAW